VLFWDSVSLKGFFLETMKTQVLIWKWTGKEVLTFFVRLYGKLNGSPQSAPNMVK
jgi:hypothetical protein